MNILELEEIKTNGPDGSDGQNAPVLFCTTHGGALVLARQPFGSVHGLIAQHRKTNTHGKQTSSPREHATVPWIPLNEKTTAQPRATWLGVLADSPSESRSAIEFRVYGCRFGDRAGVTVR